LIWMLIVVMALAATAIVLLPWLRTGRHTYVDRSEANVVAYRQRLVELDAEVAAGNLAADSYAAAEQELARRLLDDTRGAQEVKLQQRSGRAIMLLVLLALPAVGLLWYWQAGSWRVQDMVVQAQEDPHGAMEAMLENLEQRLARAPDGSGYAMLGRSYATLERHAEAARAYAEANRLVDDPVPDWLVAEGEALAMARNRDLIGRPAMLFEAAVRLDPLHTRGLWFAGLAALQADDLATATQHWTVLLEQGDLPDGLRHELAQRVAAMTGEAPPAAPPPSPAVAADGGTRLELRVALAPALQAGVADGAALFVFAQAADGPAMPLAVQRMTAAELPRTVVLDDSMSMTGALKLSQFDEWVVTARVTAHGGVEPRSGDFEGRVRVTAAAAADATVPLTIDRQLP
jgi:cytochrome c-type biogenesis protein CcmH